MHSDKEQMPRPLFRREALEQLDSPAQLQEAIRIVSPRAWLALLGVLMLLGAGLGWGVFGRIPTVVTARGVIVPEGGYTIVTATPGDPGAASAPGLTHEPLDPRRRVVVYLPLAQAARVAPGMPVRIRPLTAGGSGVDLRGLVAAVGEQPATRAEMRRALGSDAWVNALRAAGLVAAITVDFDPAGGAGRPAPVLKAGAPCDVIIITGERAPLQLHEH